MPKPKLTVDGDAAGATVPGMILDFDLTALRTNLGPLTGALNDLLGQIPAEAGQLKSLLQAAANLSPRIVFTLGLSTASVDTSQPIDIPVPDVDTDDPEPTDDSTEAAPPRAVAAPAVRRPPVTLRPRSPTRPSATPRRSPRRPAPSRSPPRSRPGCRDCSRSRCC